MKSTKIISLAAALLILCVLQSPGYFGSQPENTSHFNYIMARLYLRDGDIEEALIYLQKAAELDEKSTAIRWDLFEVYYIMGDYSRARDIGEELLELKPLDTEIMEAMAELYSYLGEKKSSVEMYENILTEDPEHLKIRQDFALYLLKEGQYKKAMKHYQKILKKDPTYINAILGIGDLYLEKDHYRAAVRTYKQAGECGADRREVNLQIARIYSHTGSNFRAAKYLQKNIEKDPRDVQSLYLLAGIYDEENKINAADEIYKQLLEVTGENYSINLNRGTMYLDAGKVKRAEKIFKELSRNYPEEFYGWYLLGLSRLFRDDYQGAREALEKALEIREDVDVYFNLGIAAEKRGMKEKSYEMFKKCIEMDPNHDLALNYLGYLWVEEGINLTLAGKYIKRALEIEPEKPAYIDSMGWFYYRRGNYDKALEKIKRAAKLEHDPEIFEHLGDVYIKLGKNSAALKIYYEALKMDPENKTLIEKIENLKK